jgi:hypothetical protein
VAPTGVESAFSGFGSTTYVSFFSGTSAATPVAAAAFASFMAFRLANPGPGGAVPARGEFMASIIAAGENYGLPNNNVGAGAYRPGVLDNTTTGNTGRNVWATVNLTA